MAKTQQRFAVDEEDAVITSWIEAQKNLSMSVHVLIHDYVKRFGSTDAYAAVLARGFGPATEAVIGQGMPSAVRIPAQTEQKPAPVKSTPAKKKPSADAEVLVEDKTEQEVAEKSIDGTSSKSFGFAR